MEPNQVGVEMMDGTRRIFEGVTFVDVSDGTLALGKVTRIPEVKTVRWMKWFTKTENTVRSEVEFFGVFARGSWANYYRPSTMVPAIVPVEAPTKAKKSR